MASSAIYGGTLSLDPAVPGIAKSSDDAFTVIATLRVCRAGHFRAG